MCTQDSIQRVKRVYSKFSPALSSTTNSQRPGVLCLRPKTFLRMDTSGSVISDLFYIRERIASAVSPLLPTRHSVSEIVPCEASLGFLVALQGVIVWLSQHFFTRLLMGAWVVCGFCSHTLQGISLAPCHFAHLRVSPKGKFLEAELLGRKVPVFNF